jgi:hypothetical protein
LFGGWLVGVRQKTYADYARTNGSAEIRSHFMGHNRAGDNARAKLRRRRREIKRAALKDPKTAAPTQAKGGAKV